MGEVLIYATATTKDIGERGVDGGVAGIELEIGVDSGREVGKQFDDGSPGRKTLGGVFMELGKVWNTRRGKA
jgi:hypothetical protein